MEIFRLGCETPLGDDLAGNGPQCVGAAHKITDLQAAARDANRVNVFINGKFEFSLDIAQVVDLGVKVGRELTAAEMDGLRAASEFGKLYQRTLEWVLTRPHSVKETRDYLKRCQMKRKSENKVRAANRQRSREERVRYHLATKILPEIEDAQMELVIQRLGERGYLDDVKFAKFYIENRFVKKGVSRKRLEMELRNKGIAAEDIENALAGNERSEEEEIRKVIAKRGRKYTSEPEKLVQYLMRQGFDYQLSQSLVREMDSRSWE